MKKTVILHPSIWNSVDLGVWEDLITKRAARDWRALVAIQAVVIVLGAISLWPLLFVSVPGFWYFGKHRAIKMYAQEINSEFETEGFDVEKLMAEIPSLLADERVERELEKEAERKRLAEEEYNSKFGKPQAP